MNDRMIINTVFQMMYQRKVSKKYSTRSVIYMVVNVNAAWLVQRAAPKNLSVQPWTFMLTHDCDGVIE